MIRLSRQTLLLCLFLSGTQFMQGLPSPDTVTGLVQENQDFDSFSTPATIVFSPNQTTAYIVNYNALAVEMIDIATNTVVGQVDDSFSSFDYPDGMAITSDAQTLYVSNNYYDEVCIIRTSDNVMIGRVSDEDNQYFDYPQALAITPDGTKMYVLNGSGQCQVVVVDLTLHPVATIGVVSGTSLSTPAGIAITPDGTKAYVIDASNNNVTIIDVATDTVTGIVSDVGNTIQYPYGIAITPDGSKAYVANYYGGQSSSGSVSVINVSTNTVTGLVSGIFTYPQSVAVLPSGLLVYVSNAGDEDTGSVNIIDASTDTVIGLVVDTGYPFDTPNQIGVSIDGAKLYVSSQGNNTVNVVESLITILPPTNLVGKSLQNDFMSQINLINVIGFDAPTSGTVPVAYKVYRNQSLTDLAGIVSREAILPFQSTFIFLDGNRQYNTIYTYYVTSVDMDGNESDSVSISIRTLVKPRNS